MCGDWVEGFQFKDSILPGGTWQGKTQEECKAACAATKGCNAASWDKHTKACTAHIVPEHGFHPTRSPAHNVIRLCASGASKSPAASHFTLWEEKDQHPAGC